MSRYWWNDTDDKLEQMRKLFAGVVNLDDVAHADLKARMTEQLEEIQAEQERRARARAIPAIPFGKKVEVIELLPDVSVCATPPVGMVGTSLGEEYPGATAVQFSRQALYPRPDGEEHDDPHAVLFMPNYSIRVVQ